MSITSSKMNIFELAKNENIENLGLWPDWKIGHRRR
jgi:hypothetical protein